MNNDHVDVLAIGAHPDDVELGAGGTIAKLIGNGKSVSILDLTLGELGTRGNAETRKKEARTASDILGLNNRYQLNLGDGNINNSLQNKLQVISYIRLCKPSVILANAVSDRHIDHGNAATLVKEAVFLSGLVKVETTYNNLPQEPHKPLLLLNYIQDYYHKPDLVVDISLFRQKKMDAIRAFSSQFYKPDSTEPATPISGSDFLDFLEARMREMGRWIHASHGEGFISQVPLNPELLARIFAV